MTRALTPVISCLVLLTSFQASTAFAAANAAGTSPATAARWPRVAPVDFSRITPDDFTDDELDLVAPLAHFAPVANAIVEEGPNRGFIDISVWRRPKDNKHWNARVMENVLSLAWFYTADRKWNPYRGDPAVRVRLEAALDFIGRIQAPDGSFSEYNPKGYNLAAVAFMAKFLGRTLENLAAPGAPATDAEVLGRAHATLRKALIVTLTREKNYKNGSFFTNQYGNVWPGGLSWLRLHPDDTEVRGLWENAFARARLISRALRDFSMKKTDLISRTPSVPMEPIPAAPGPTFATRRSRKSGSTRKRPGSDGFPGTPCPSPANRGLPLTAPSSRACSVPSSITCKRPCRSSSPPPAPSP